LYQLEVEMVEVLPQLKFPKPKVLLRAKGKNESLARHLHC